MARCWDHSHYSAHWKAFGKIAAYGTQENEFIRRRRQQQQRITNQNETPCTKWEKTTLFRSICVYGIIRLLWHAKYVRIAYTCDINAIGFAAFFYTFVHAIHEHNRNRIHVQLFTLKLNNVENYTRVYTHNRTHILTLVVCAHKPSHNAQKSFQYTNILRTRDTPKILSTYYIVGFIHTIVATRHEVHFHSIGKRQTLKTKCMRFRSTIWLGLAWLGFETNVWALAMVSHLGCHFFRSYLLLFPRMWTLYVWSFNNASGKLNIFSNNHPSTCSTMYNAISYRANVQAQEHAIQLCKPHFLFLFTWSCLCMCVRVWFLPSKHGVRI